MPDRGADKRALRISAGERSNEVPPAMSDTTDNPGPEESQIGVADLEVQQLLEEAESLTSIIAEETGAKPAEPTASPPTDEPAAVPAPPENLNDLLNDPDVQARTAAPKVSSDLDVEQERGVEGAPSTNEAAGEADDEVGAPKDVSPSANSLKKRLRTLSHLCANVVITPFVFLDRPFENVSPQGKRLIGLVAVATCLVGIASWVLPGLVNHNPFAAMDLGTLPGR